MNETSGKILRVNGPIVTAAGSRHGLPCTDVLTCQVYPRASSVSPRMISQVIWMRMPCTAVTRAMMTTSSS